MNEPILPSAVSPDRRVARGARADAGAGRGRRRRLAEDLKLQTTASVMHTTAHPDDEHGGMLAMLSRGQGARLSLLTLTRGESGDNAIGPELFDAPRADPDRGAARSPDRYYGVDRQYFTTVVDYGFSKRLDEALEKWGTRARAARRRARHPHRTAAA